MRILIAEDDPVSRRLLEWTGQPWMFTLGEGEGAPTLQEQKRQAKEQAVREAAEHPLVRAALEAFPGAVVHALHDLTPVAAEAEPADGAVSADDEAEDGVSGLDSDGVGDDASSAEPYPPRDRSPDG